MQSKKAGRIIYGSAVALVNILLSRKDQSLRLSVVWNEVLKTSVTVFYPLDTQCSSE